jgi:large subunit ribosomal protein L6
MSRIGKQPINLPAGVSVDSKGRTYTVKGPKGSLEIEVRPEIDVAVEGTTVTVTPNGSGSAREARALHGTTRALLQNMVTGVSEGYTKTLEINGVGWNAKGQAKQLDLNIGFCHPVHLPLPEGVTVETPNPTVIVVTGIDKHAVGQYAANVRAVRPPEPYKGKGIRYKGEVVRRKVGKSFGS